MMTRCSNKKLRDEWLGVALMVFVAWLIAFGWPYALGIIAIIIGAIL